MNGAPRRKRTTQGGGRAVMIVFLLVATLTLLFDCLYFMVLTHPSSDGTSVRQSKPLILSTSKSSSSFTNTTTSTAVVSSASAVVHDIGNDLEPVLAVFRQAGIELDEATRQKLPTMKQVVEQYGSHPYFAGLDTCADFQSRVPPEHRMLGAAGMFSTGTNLVTTLLKKNCQIPERVAKYGINATKEQHGMRWQVPWGKHTPEAYRLAHSTEKAKNIDKEDILPVITIRNPWRWMQSMCKNPYSARWPHHSQCPRLKLGDDAWNNVSVKYGAATEHYESLVALWNDWYRAYLQADYPHIVIRMEDLVFATEATITTACECAGGRIRSDQPFQYITDSAKKDSPGHDTTTGFTEAWIKYSKPLQRQAGFKEDDYEAALSALDSDIMQMFGYQHPPT